MTNCETIEWVFNSCFSTSFSKGANALTHANERGVELLGGASEPLYVPATADTPARLYYREDYAASALHEVAHWCIAGAQRRQLEDFGYHYIEPPRTTAQQRAFFACELRTQALECLFARSAQIEFHVSADAPGFSTANFAAQVADNVTLMNGWMGTPAGQRAGYFNAQLRMAVQSGADAMSR